MRVRLMKGLFIGVVWVLSGGEVSAQKNDYQWLFGYDNFAADTDTTVGGVIMDFNYPLPQISKHIRIADFDFANVSYCDYNGNLLFYSNGDAVFDSRDSVMLNGDSLNYSWYWNDWLSSSYPIKHTGLRIPQDLLALPKPGDSTKVYLCHYTVNRSLFPSGYGDYPCDSSFYSLIDLSANGGLGEVTAKNIIINRDSLSYGSFSAVKHGNGRDWWILHPYWQGNNHIYEFALTDTGIGLHKIQHVGTDRLWDGALGASCFSPNGEKYFWVNAIDGIRMFDFDRCSGTLSNPEIIPFPFLSFGDSVVLVGGVAVSPNNRYLYVVSTIVVLQYDLQASNIGNSVDTVAFWDGTFDPYPPLAANFFMAQLGPDGKIYINSTNSVKSLHVINRPDLPGDSCLFAQHSVHLNAFNESSLPNFPNYRIGSWAGSACDTLNMATEDVRAAKEKIIKIFPTPANDYTIVDYGFTDWSKGEASLEISNELGQRVYTQKLPMYSGYQKIDVSKFAAGLYNAAIVRNNEVVGVGKFVKSPL